MATTTTLGLSQTLIGKKAAMAISGFILVGFVLGHLVGNLQLYAGPETINAYSAMLHGLPALLWAARLILLAAVAVHIVTAVQLAGRNLEARPQRYQGPKKHLASTYASRTMYMSGPILLLFIVYHLLHLTFGYTPGYRFDANNVYDNVVYGFQRPWVSAVYIAGNLALAFHLYHGVWSMLQTVGANHPRYNRLLLRSAQAVALVVAVGNVSFPLSVLAGWVKPSSELTGAK